MTVDVACHGVPGPGVWEQYVKALENRHGARMRAASFRDKSQGWRHYVFRTTYSSPDKEVSVKAAADPYMALFMQDMTLRPSCYSCPARHGRSGSDLTLSDLWSVAEAAPDLNDDRGVSGVMVNTERGSALLDRIHAETKQSIPVDAVTKDNGGFAESIAVPEKRDEFFAGLKVAGVDVYEHMKSYLVKKPLYKRISRCLRSGLVEMKRKIVK